MKCSKAGQDGYDIEWEGHQWRFHEACAAAIDDAHQRLLDTVCDLAVGLNFYKVEQDLVDLGMQGADAYGRDEDGNFIVEGRGPGNPKMLRPFFLELVPPENTGSDRCA